MNAQQSTDQPTPPSVQTSPDDKFQKAASFTFGAEGGYTVDNGGPTNYGITQTTLDGFNAKHGYPSQSVKDMTSDDAKFVAKNEYFDGPQFGNLPDRTAVAAFDYAMNSGQHQAILDLQRTVGVNPDGRMGPRTQMAVSQYVSQNGEDALLQDYVSRRQKLMGTLIHNNPAKYGSSQDGWANRIDSLKSYLGVAQNDQ